MRKNHEKTHIRYFSHLQYFLHGHLEFHFFFQLSGLSTIPFSTQPMTMGWFLKEPLLTFQIYIGITFKMLHNLSLTLTIQCGSVIQIRLTCPMHVIQCSHTTDTSSVFGIDVWCLQTGRGYRHRSPTPNACLSYISRRHSGKGSACKMPCTLAYYNKALPVCCNSLHFPPDYLPVRGVEKDGWVEEMVGKSNLDQFYNNQGS